MKEWTVKNDVRLDKFLYEKVPSLSYGILRKYLKENKIKVEDVYKRQVQAAFLVDCVIVFAHQHLRSPPFSKKLSKITHFNPFLPIYSIYYRINLSLIHIFAPKAAVKNANFSMIYTLLRFYPETPVVFWNCL